MKKMYGLFMVVMAIGVLMLSACAPVAGAMVQLDPALADWIVFGCTVLVGFLLVKANEIPFVAHLLKYLKVEQYKFAISAWLAGIAIQFLQAGILDKIPSMWDNVATIVMQLLVAVIVTLYSFRLLRDRGVNSFQ